jgi:hypothetical protein
MLPGRDPRMMILVFLSKIGGKPYFIMLKEAGTQGYFKFWKRIN